MVGLLSGKRSIDLSRGKCNTDLIKNTCGFCKKILIVFIGCPPEVYDAYAVIYAYAVVFPKAHELVIRSQRIYPYAVVYPDVGDLALSIKVVIHMQWRTYPICLPIIVGAA